MAGESIKSQIFSCQSQSKHNTALHKNSGLLSMSLSLSKYLLDLQADNKRMKGNILDEGGGGCRKLSGKWRRDGWRSDNKFNPSIHPFIHHIHRFNYRFSFRAVYLCRDARSTSSQPIRTNQGDTSLRSYQVRSQSSSLWSHVLI